MKKFEKIEIGKIRVIGKRRKAHPEAVVTLAQSIQLVGLIHPIIVVRMENDLFQLCSGLYRVRAMQKLGEKEINAFVHEVGEINCEKVEIDDNLNESTTYREGKS